MGFDVGGQRLGNRGRSAARNGPAAGMPQGAQHQAGAGGGDRGQRRHGMRGDAAEQCGSQVLPEPGIPQRRALFERPDAERGGRRRVRRNPHQLVQGQVSDAVHPPHEGRHEPAVGGAVPAEFRSGAVQGTVRQRRPAAVERGSVRDIRHRQGHAPGQLEPAEKGRGQDHGVHGRADVVEVARFHQFGGAQSAAGRGGRLEHVDFESGPRHGHRRCQPVGAGTDDGDVSHARWPSATALFRHGTTDAAGRRRSSRSQSGAPSKGPPCGSSMRWRRITS